jgi:hypothetical protein
MKEGYEYSKRVAVVAALAVCSAASMYCICKEIEGRCLGRLNSLGRAEIKLEQEIAAMSGVGDSELTALRSTIGRLRVSLDSGDAGDLILRRLGDSWSVEPGPKEDRNGFSLQTSTLRMRSPTPADWQNIVDIIGALERLPGVGIASFEMSTMGDTGRRNIKKMRLGLEIRSRSADSIPGNP